MKNLVGILTFVLAAQTAHAQARVTTLDDWTTNLGKNPAATASQLGDLTNTISKFQLTQELLDQLNGAIANVRLSNLVDYQRLAGQLMTARQQLRFRSDLNVNIKRESLYLLEQLAEETLYVSSVRFPTLNPEYNFVGDAGPITTTRAAKLRLFTVQTGDILLSKATGNGSSTFIALSMNMPHIYSHSAPVYIEPQTMKLQSPESFIEDGLKLRDLTKDYLIGSKTRLAIYRFEGLSSVQRLQVINEATGNLDRFVQTLSQRTGGDPFNKTSFPYDFNMDPIKANGQKYFCSSVAYQVYPAPTDLRNPYAQALWSFVSGGRENLFRMLGIQSVRIPAPGDLELNPLFRLVGFRVDVLRLRQERIENAIVDSFLSWAEVNPAITGELRRRLEAVGNRPLTRDDVQKLIASGLVPEEMRAGLEARIGQAPDNANVKQLIFFYVMNDLVTPKMRDTMLNTVLLAERQGRLIGPVELRRMAVTLGAQVWVQALQTLQARLGPFGPATPPLAPWLVR